MQPWWARVCEFVCVWLSVRACDSHRRWSWGLRFPRRPHGGWRYCGSCSSPPAWSSWPSWPLRWPRWQLLPPPLSGLGRGGGGDVTAEVETVHLRELCRKNLLNENKQGRVSQRRRRNGCEVTICCFIFWQPILSQQVIPLMGWIPVHGSIICILYECFTNSHAPRQYIDVFAPWFEPFRSSRDAAHQVWAEAEYIAQTGWCSVTAEGSGRGKGEREIRIKDVDKDRKKKKTSSTYWACSNNTLTSSWMILALFKFLHS